MSVEQHIGIEQTQVVTRAIGIVEPLTNLRAGALSRRTDGEEYPEYTPNFIKLAESYGAKGIRVMKKEDIAAAFEEAKKNTKTPTIIEFIIDPEEMVYPMIKPGGTLEDMIMDC